MISQECNFNEVLQFLSNRRVLCEYKHPQTDVSTFQQGLHYLNLSCMHLHSSSSKLFFLQLCYFVFNSANKNAFISGWNDAIFNFIYVYI